MAECAVCGEGPGRYSYDCNYCGREHCSDHRLPEHHDCPSKGSGGSSGDAIMDERLSSARERHEVAKAGGVKVTERPSETSGPSRLRRYLTYVAIAVLGAILALGGAWYVGVV